MQNNYTNYYKNHNSKSLLEIVNAPDVYNDEARLAAFELLKQKGETFAAEQEFEFKQINKKLIQENLVSKEESPKKESHNLPQLFSPTAILGFSIFLEPLFGAILLYHNLKEQEKKSPAKAVLLIGISLLVFKMALVYYQYFNQIYSLVLSIGAGIIFIEMFWKKHIGLKTAYKRKSIWKPLFLFLAIIFAIFGLQLYLDPELYQQLLEQRDL